MKTETVFWTDIDKVCKKQADKNLRSGKSTRSSLWGNINNRLANKKFFVEIMPSGWCIMRVGWRNEVTR